MIRSLKKGPYVVGLEDTNEVEARPIAHRRSLVVPSHVGEKVQVSTGRHWLTVHVTQEMVGHLFGEFASTKVKVVHKVKKK